MTQSSPARDGLPDLLRRRIVVAPMAGGPTTADLVIAAARAGALGFLAAGYKTPEAMAAEITAVRAATAEPFGVNVFVPGAPYRDAAALAGYLGSLGPGLGDASRPGTTTASTARSRRCSRIRPRSPASPSAARRPR